MPSPIDYRFYIVERKRVSKNVKLNPKVYVTSLNSVPLPGTTGGKHIIIGGTVATNPESVFLAVFNTQYNITEYIWEEPSDVREIFKGIQYDKLNDQSIGSF